MDSIKEKRIKEITQLYYSREDVQKTIFEFSKNREISPRYYEGFGKRPDSFQYPSDIFEFAKKGATSFNCSEELWRDPLEIKTNMSPEEYNKLRIGWDLLLDIDSKYIDYSKITAQLVVEVLKFHGVKNFGIKFSGSKGFHIIVPWAAFPKEVQGKKTSDMFPNFPRILLRYITEKIKEPLIQRVSELMVKQKYVKDFQVPKEVMPDIILISPRHLFRMPYSLHEKTALASVVLSEEELKNFEMKDASPFKIKLRNFSPASEKDEAKELLSAALDWDMDNEKKKTYEGEEKKEVSNYEPIKLKDVSEEDFPNCIRKILEGMQDGKKRALFVLLNLFRSLGMEKAEVEKRISIWNEKNSPKLMEGYIKSQLIWSYRRKPLMPPNFGDFYKNLGVDVSDEFRRNIKNPVQYIIKKSKLRIDSKKSQSTKTKKSRKRK